MILGFASLVLSQLQNESQRDAVQQIELAARRAAGLTGQMLAYAGKGKFVVEPARISEVVKEMTELIQSTISAKASLTLSLAPDTPMIDADLSQLRQIVLNLITNAAEALGERSGTIALATGAVDSDRAYLAGYELADELPEGRYAFLEVTDSGAGMDTDTRAKIFDPFFTTKYTGRGLGLAAVLGILRGHHGAINVYSEPGKGTSFKLLFPASPHSTVATPSAGEADDWRGSGTILVVDDDQALRAMAGCMLERLGFDAEYASDGAQALEMLARPDTDLVLVLLDLTMPNMDGEEALAALERKGTTVPIILCSGYNAQDISQRLVARHVAAFLQKPYRLAELSATIQRVLQARTEVS